MSKDTPVFLYKSSTLRDFINNPKKKYNDFTANHYHHTRIIAMNIILYLLNIIQYQYIIIGQLFNFICRYIPLKQ